MDVNQRLAGEHSLSAVPVQVLQSSHSCVKIKTESAVFGLWIHLEWVDMITITGDDNRESFDVITQDVN